MKAACNKTRKVFLSYTVRLKAAKSQSRFCACTCSSEPSLLADAVIINFKKKSYCIKKNKIIHIDIN